MSKNTIEKMSKSLHKKTVTIVVIFFVLGLLIGFGAYKFITKDDCFKLIGQETLELNIGASEYVEEGVIIKAFGKDISDQVKIDATGVDYQTAGEYYILYTVDSPIYQKYTLYRTITIVDPTAPGTGA